MAKAADQMEWIRGFSFLTKGLTVFLKHGRVGDIHISEGGTSFQEANAAAEKAGFLRLDR